MHAPLTDITAGIAHAHPSLLGEGPVWDEAAQTLHWLDVLQGHIHSLVPATGDYRRMALDQMVGAIAPRRKGGYIAALQKGLGFLDVELGTYEIKARPEADLPGNRFNDGKCDPAGRFWAGTMALDETPGAGTLYCVDRDLTYIPRVSGTTISNGMAWNKAQDRFYHIDTPTREVVCYDYDLAGGALSNRRTVIRIAEEEGFPDGMTIDDEDMLWIAHYDGWQVTRRDPRNGNILARIRLPVAKVTSCTFGGPGMDELYITTASKEMSPEEHAAQPYAGALFVARDTGHKGFAPFGFAG